MINVCHLEDYPTIRKAVQALVDDEPEINYLSSCPEIADLQIALKETAIDVLVLNVDAERGAYKSIADYLMFCKSLLALYRSLSIVIHSKFHFLGWVQKFQQAGVKGFVSKYAPGEDIVSAIKAVSRGQEYICPLLEVELKIFATENLKSPNYNQPAFSRREIQVLHLLRRGFGTKEIADQLFISSKTVETHRSHLVAKAGAKNTAELIQLSVERGY